MYSKKAVKCYKEGRILQQKGKLSEAERAYKKVIKINRDFIEAHSDLGNILLDQGRYKEAFNSFRKALSLRPNHPLLLTNLGNALQLQGETEKAIDWFNKAITADPNFIGAHNNLGNALRNMGSFQEAVASYRQAIRIKTDIADTYYNLASVLVQLDELGDAVSNFIKAIEIEPRHQGAYNGLGNALAFQGELVEAASAYRKAIEIYPGHRFAHNGLGNVLSDLGELDEAIACYRKAIDIDPAHREAYNGLGQVLSNKGETENAIAAYRRALEIEPRHKQACIGLANALSDYGEIDEAVEVYGRSIEINPEHTEAYRSLSKNKKFSRYDEDICAMESLYENEGYTDQQKLHLAFGLGKAYEDLQEYEKSMEFILQANRLKRSTFNYSISEDEELFSRIKCTFSAEFFSSRKGVGSQDSTPIFILGMPRSGTSLVEQILGSHPDVYGGGELNDLTTLATRARAADPPGKFPASIVDLDSAAMLQMGNEYVSRIRKHSGDTKHVTDKMPHNFLYIGLISIILPNAKIINCSRDSMDNCLSLLKNYFNTAHHYSYDMTELGQYYNLYLDLMQHWRGTLPGFIYDLSYEQLVTNQEKQISELLEYCDLPWDQACLDFHKTRRKVKTASNAQVRRPIYKDSVKLWKRYEKQLEPLRKIITG